jgi:hypothetical protein
MKYYTFRGEFDSGEGTLWMEIDAESDIVTRQVSREDVGTWHHGKFDGTISFGHIGDRYASELDLKSHEETSREEFEQAWNQAMRGHRD